MDPHRNWQHGDDKWVSSGSKQGLWHLLFSFWQCLPPSVTPQPGSELPWYSQWPRLGIEARRERMYAEQTKREQRRVSAKSHLQRIPRLRGGRSFSMCQGIGAWRAPWHTRAAWTCLYFGRETTGYSAVLFWHLVAPGGTLRPRSFDFRIRNRLQIKHSVCVHTCTRVHFFHHTI